MSIPNIQPKYTDASSPTLPAGSRSSNLLTREQYVQYKINEGSSPQQAENAAKFLYDGQGEVFNIETGVGQPPSSSFKQPIFTPNEEKTSVTITAPEPEIQQAQQPDPNAFITVDAFPEGSGFQDNVTNVPDDLANEMGVETFDTTGNTNMADNFGTASDAAKTVLEGGAAPQQITYGATLTPQDDRQIIDTEGKFVDGTISPTAAQATTSQATMPDQFGVAQATTQTTVGGVEDVVANTQAATGTVSQTMDAATKDPYSTAVSGAPGAAQISQPTRVEAPEPLAVTPEMLVSGVADARVASAFAEEVQAAQAQPSEKATVQGQLVNLMAQFEEGDTPAWAAGAMRKATAMMAQRGMSASSLAGQAIVQAAMESALPIAQADAQTQAQFESQNLSNRQQRAMLAAQQRAQFIGQEFDQAFQARVQNAARVADIAGINFNAQQQIALENARIANSVDLANLNNKQARIMAEVAQIASLESQNLNNRQQAAQQNAQAFLQMDMANLSNQQQTELFKSQSKIQALFTDAAAENAASQFNASSQNQVNQFFANLFSQTSQFNATQENAISQFNADQRNVITRFTEEINNQREQFNASNRLVIDQANANWFRNVATADTAAINFANNQSVGNLLAFTTTSLNNMYQAERDTIEQAWKSGENDLERATDIILQRIVGEIELAVADKESSAKDSNTIGQWIRDIIGWM